MTKPSIIKITSQHEENNERRNVGDMEGIKDYRKAYASEERENRKFPGSFGKFSC